MKSDKADMYIINYVDQSHPIIMGYNCQTMLGNPKYTAVYAPGLMPSL